MNAMRLVRGTLWIKALAVGLVFLGLTEKWSAIIVAALVAVVVVKKIRDGIREQVWATPEELTDLYWNNLVYDNSVWINPETPEQGVARLAGPYRSAA